MPFFYVKIESVREFAVLSDSPESISDSRVMDDEKSVYGDDICVIAIGTDPMSENDIKFAEISDLDVFDLDGNIVTFKEGVR
jgi:hypothetical protein